jgi:hypothetical protein
MMTHVTYTNSFTYQEEQRSTLVGGDLMRKYAEIGGVVTLGQEQSHQWIRKTQVGGTTGT